MATPTPTDQARYLLGGTPAALAAALHARVADVAAPGERAAVVAALMTALRRTAAELDVLEAPSRPPRVYVAGGSRERLMVVRPLIRALQARGVAVTEDWTAAPEWDAPPGTLDAATLARCARADLEGVLAADVLWYVAPVHRSEGSHAELGAALALRLRVVVSGAGAASEGRIFPLLAAEGDHYATHGEALEAVCAMATARRAGAGSAQ